MPDKEALEYFVRATYPAKKGTEFDFKHYEDIHVPLGSKQMAAGDLDFDRREIETHVAGFFDGQPQDHLSITYYSSDETFIDRFRKFMGTDLVQPLIEDAKIYTDSEPVWSAGVIGFK